MIMTMRQVVFGVAKMSQISLSMYKTMIGYQVYLC